jgi:hypothetical protein
VVGGRRGQRRLAVSDLPAPAPAARHPVAPQAGPVHVA